MIKYRCAEPTEFHKLVDIFKDHHDQSIYSVLEFSYSEIINNLTYCFLNPSKGRVFIAVDDSGDIVGVCLSMMRKLVTSSDYIAQETGLAVLPKYKGVGVAKILIDDFKQWAIEHKCKMAMVNSSLGIDNARATAFFEKSGFNVIGCDLGVVL